MIKKLIISRTDGIGDVVLTLPLAGLMKKLHPGIKIWFVGRSYTRPVITACEHVDEFVNWDEVSGYTHKEKIEFIKALQADAIVHVFPNRELAKIACHWQNSATYRYFASFPSLVVLQQFDKRWPENVTSA